MEKLWEDRVAGRHLEPADFGLSYRESNDCQRAGLLGLAETSRYIYNDDAVRFVE